MQFLTSQADIEQAILTSLLPWPFGWLASKTYSSVTSQTNSSAFCTPGLGSAQKSGFSEQGGPFGALLAPWVQTVMQAELLAWKYFPGNILSFRPFPVLCFAEELGSGMRQALLFSCELSFPPISLRRSFCRICFYCTLAHFGSSRVIHFLTVCDHMHGCCQWWKSPAFSWTKISPWCLMCCANGTRLFPDFWLSQNQVFKLCL